MFSLFGFLYLSFAKLCIFLKEKRLSGAFNSVFIDFLTLLEGCRGDVSKGFCSKCLKISNLK